MTEKQFKVVDDYLVCYDGDYFDLHKSSDVRSLVSVANYIVDENEQLKQLFIDYAEIDEGELEEELAHFIGDVE